jgi:hypothetical protein
MSQPAIRQVAGAPRKNFRNTGASTGQLKSEPILVPVGSCRFEETISRREPTCTTRRCASAGSGGGGVRIRAGADRACRARRIKAGGKARGQPRRRERNLFPRCASAQADGPRRHSTSWPWFSSQASSLSVVHLSFGARTRWLRIIATNFIINGGNKFASQPPFPSALPQSPLLALSLPSLSGLSRPRRALSQGAAAGGTGG